MIIKTALVSAVVDRELSRIGRDSHTIIGVAILCTGVFHHIALAALEYLSTIAVVEYNVHIVPGTVSSSDVDVIIACTTLCIVGGTLLIVVNSIGTVRFVDTSDLVGGVFLIVRNYSRFVKLAVTAVHRNRNLS